VKQRKGDKQEGCCGTSLLKSGAALRCVAVSPPAACKTLNNIRETKTDQRRHWQVDSTLTPEAGRER